MRADSRDVGDRTVDVAIIGAGPAGLSCALRLRERGCSFVVIDAGKGPDVRNHSDPVEAVAGVGGAGLFSDGKFSWYPSATALWKLKGHELADAEAWTRKLMRCIGILDIPQRAQLLAEDVPQGKPGQWHLKEYPTWYAGLSQRLSLIASMFRYIGEERFVLNTLVVLSGCDGDWLLHDKMSGHLVTRAKKVVVASGRFWHLFLRSQSVISQRYRRIEFGVRLETACDNVFFTEVTAGVTDPKFLFQLPPGLEFRTFCCIKGGEVVQTEFGRYRTCSGRADGRRDGGVSNIGFNCRVLNPELGERILSEGLLERACGEHFTAEFSDAAVLRQAFGPTAAALFQQGLVALADRHPMLAQARMRGPTIEGVGSYPAVSEDLRTPDGIYVAGDATGLFRGLVAALVSGHYVGSAMNFPQRDEAKIHRELRYGMPLVVVCTIALAMAVVFGPAAASLTAA